MGSPKGRSKGVKKLKEFKSEQPTPEIEQDTQETNVSHLSTELEAIATTSPIKTENIFNEKPDVTLEKNEKENIPPVEVKSPRKMFLSPIFLKKPKSKASDPDYKPKKSKKKKKKEQPVDKKQPLISSFLRRSTRVPTGEKRKIDQQVLEDNLSITD